jgi:hypothetical protein
LPHTPMSLRELEGLSDTSAGPSRPWLRGLARLFRRSKRVEGG